MIRFISIVLLLFTFSLMFSQKTQKIKGDREVLSVTQSLNQNFKALEITDNISVRITPGKVNSYSLTADQNLHDLVAFVIDNNVLRISTSAEITRNKKLEVNLTVKDLERITLKDDASLKTAKKLRFDKIIIDADNSSKFDLDLDVKEIQIRMHEKASGKIGLKAKDLQIEMNDKTRLNGKLNVNSTMATINDRSSLNLNGNSGNSSFKLKSSADVDAKNLKSTTAEIESSNSAKITLKVSRKLEINAADKSRVYIYGNPDIQLKGFTNKAQVIKK
ncbi:GIN domain-containing protein [Gillisia limnaea]|uniref:Putative auto-transporter adhesin head GIN domain-containing protein n=1 Tax=Gillisia limnaea (strain DSM 15749 / LMG 21470 / R-8282) TaxID=865937 RepID=H2BZ64_GILLR|nr:DUF2807 domain-containing protein [Gillisia limnaea]EHQ01193.1 hypothetical protein Gilli_0481 [Gillisia limnaea DSM 15749]